VSCEAQRTAGVFTSVAMQHRLLVALSGASAPSIARCDVNL